MSKTLCVGSWAIGNEPYDCDFFCDSYTGNHQEVKDGALATTYINRYGSDLVDEYHVPKPGTSWAMVLDRYGKNGIVRTIPIEAELALKKAYLILPSPKWQRTMSHYTSLKKKLDVEAFDPVAHGVGEIFTKHREECLTLAKSHPKLDRSKDEFFGKESYDILDHDSLHEAVASYDKPLYTRYLVDEVKTSRVMWENLLSLEDKIKAVAEEASVLSLERSLVPYLFMPGRGYKGDKETFRFALQKICTTITSGWFRDFAIEYYEQAAAYYPTFRPSFFRAWHEGRIKVNNKELVDG